MSIKRKNDRRSLKTLSPEWTLPISPASTPVTVLAVQQSGPNSLDWTFSSPVSTTGSNVPQFQASGDGVTFVSPTSVSGGGGGSDTVTALYPTGLNLRFAGATGASPVILGSIFRVVTLPTNVSFTDGALSLPQSGQVTTPSLAAKKRAARKQPAQKQGTPKQTAPKKSKLKLLPAKSQKRAVQITRAARMTRKAA